MRMQIKKFISAKGKELMTAAIMSAFTAAQAATIYIGSDGKFYDAATGGSEVSYAAGDAFDWQTGVTSWTISQNITGGGGLSSAGGKTIVMDSVYNASLGGSVSPTSVSAPLSIDLSGGATLAFTAAAAAQTYYSLDLSGVSATSKSSLTITSSHTADNYINISGTVGAYSSFKAVKGATGGTYVRTSGSLLVDANASFTCTIFQSLTNGSATTFNTRITCGLIFLGYGSTINFNVSNVTSANFYTSGANTLGYAILGGGQSFGTLIFNGDGAKTIFDLNGNDLRFTGVTNQSRTGCAMYLSDFVDGSVYFGSTLATNVDGSVVNMYAITDYVTSTAVALYQREDGYLYTTVPEPAEWAAIFGALALGFTIYRRRGNSNSSNR